MQRPSCRTPTLLMVVMLGVCALGCDRFYGVHGRVTSCLDHRPLTDARTALYLSEQDHHEAPAEADGSFDMRLNHPYSDEASRLTVSAPGFQTVERTVRPSDEGEQICLEPIASE
jgi:hypothetical protein